MQIDKTDCYVSYVLPAHQSRKERWWERRASKSDNLLSVFYCFWVAFFDVSTNHAPRYDEGPVLETPSLQQVHQHYQVDRLSLKT